MLCLLMLNIKIPIIKKNEYWKIQKKKKKRKEREKPSMGKEKEVQK